MIDLIRNSSYFGFAFSIIAYLIGYAINKKTGISFLNPVLIGIVTVIAFLRVTGISYSDYNRSASYFSYFLTPATVCFAVPLYEQLEVLKKNKTAIILGIGSGIIVSMASVLLIAVFFGMDHAAYVTLLPKSVTSPIARDIANELGGYGAVIVPVVILTGVFGGIVHEAVFRIFGITDPVARGIALGTSSHAMGTVKAFELGEVEGAVSSLSIIIAGLITVLIAPVFGMII